MSVSDRDRLLDIHDNLVKVRTHATSRATLDDEVLSAAIHRWLEIVGEAAPSLSDDLRREHGEVPWRRVVALRNRLIHGYGDVDPNLLWSIIERDVPELERQVAEVLDDT